MRRISWYNTTNPCKVKLEPKMDSLITEIEEVEEYITITKCRNVGRTKGFDQLYTALGLSVSEIR